MMKIAYDAQVDALSVVFTQAEIVASRELAPGVIVNLDGLGHAVSVEILNALARIGREALQEIAIDLRSLSQKSIGR